MMEKLKAAQASTLSSGEYFDKYRDTMETEQIVSIIGKECGSYRTGFKVWKYLTLTSAVAFIGSGIYCAAKQK
ncbi:hypothetical protein [Pontibacter anaerobius]|uniref:Uncharacterized protein n=1 Tax=Pontibacter anaerobius TaxID=2993940 RepID=A0ABT3RD07_9BACT|nr:hypothetical protein [Pontibacter anaerobius]MCX2739504.1 hypothetical protein [Pontibacter anaerobius]